MRISAHPTALRARSFPRTMVVIAFVAISALAQLQTVVDLDPNRQSQTHLGQNPQRTTR